MINNYTNLSTRSVNCLKTQVPNDVGETPTTFGKMKAKWLNNMLLALLFLVGGDVLAQTAANYTFATTSGAYSSISGTGTSVAIVGDDPAVNITALSPAFVVNGVSYTNARMSANGWLMLYATTAPTATGLYGTALSTASTNAAVIFAPCNADMNISTTATTAAYRQTIGGVHIFEWVNYSRYASGGGAEQLNFQVRLDTNNGNVSFSYGNFVLNSAFTSSPQVGWKTAGTVASNWSTDINNLRIDVTGSPNSCDWSNAVTGNANNSSMYLNTTNGGVKPTSGLTFTWSRIAPQAPVRVFTAVTGLAATTATVNWTAPTGATSYNVQYRIPGTCTWTNWSGNPVATNSVTLTGLTPVTPYQVRVQALNGANQSIYSHTPNAAGTGDGYTAAGTFTTLPNVCSGQPAASNITGTTVLCANTGTTLSLSNTYTASGISYQWQSSTTAGGPYTNLGTAATQATGNLAATTYYICTISCSAGSSFTTAEQQVLVNALPPVSITSSSPTFCNPGGTAVGLIASGASTYVWSPAAGLSATSGSVVSATPATTTTYTVTGTDGNNCSKTATSTITVYNTPTGVSASASPATICSGTSTTLTAAATLPSTVNNYSFAASTGAALNPMVGATSVIGSSVDDTASASLTLPFTFNFNGADYTTYTASPDGWIKFGAAGSSDFSNQVTDPTNLPKLYPFWDDLATGTTGNVSVLTTGVAPNRVFIVQWFVTIPRNTTGAANSTFQAWLYETSNKVEFRYGTMGVPTSASISSGLTGSATNYQSITYTSNTASTAAANDANAIAPAIGTSYVFTPPTPTFTWSPAGDVVNPNSQSTVTNTLNATQTFTVIASNNVCSAAPASATVTITPLTCSAATYSSPNCAGSNFTVTANISGGGAPYSYAWSDGAGGIYPNAATITANLPAGTYSFTCVVTDSCGASCNSNVTVVVNGLPTVTVAPTSALYCNPSTPIAITASGAATYAWSPATGLSATTGSVVNASPSANTTYTVVGTDANGCVAPSVSSVITVQPGPTPISVSSSAATVCNGTVVTLNATGGNVATSSTFVTVSPVGSILDNATTSQDVVVAGLPALATVSKVEVSFDITHTFDGDLRIDLEAPNGKIVNLVNRRGSSGANFTGTIITSDASAPSVSLAGAPFTGTFSADLADLALPTSTLVFSELFTVPNGTWILRVGDFAGGDTGTLNISSIKIFYSAPTVTSWTASAGTLYTSVNPDVAYVSGDNAATLYARPTTAATYTASATLGSCTSTGSTTVAVNQLPVFSVAPITICNGTSGTLVASSLESNSYSWTPVGGGATLSGASVSVSPTTTTTYDVTATSNTTIPACSSTSQVTVTVNEPGTIVSGTTTRTVSPGQLTTFQVVTTGLVTYQWQVNNNVSGWQNILAANPDYSGENSAILSVQNITLAFDTYQYRCLVTGLAPCATLTPIEAVLNVTNTGFLSQPQDVNLCATSTTSFGIVTTGDEPYNVQWQMSTDGGASFNDIFDGLDASGLTFSGANELNPKTLFVSGITSAHNTYKFKCQLDFFLDSGIATLTVNTPVSVTNNFSATPVIRCSAPSAAATTFGITTSGTVASVVWKYATSASGPWNTLAAGTPAGASYSGSSTNTLSVTTTGATPVGNYYYKAFVTGAGSGPNKCPDAESDVATISVVNPTVGITASSTAYCTPGSAVTLTGTGASTYAWTSSPAGFTFNGASASVTPSVATTYTVTGTDGNGCTNTASQAVTVGGSFTVAATSSAATVCPGAAVTLGATPTQLSGTTYLVNTTPYQFAASSGTFTPLVGGTAAASITATSDDTLSGSLPIGFTFNYGGTNYTNIRVNSNGLLTFNTTGTSTASNDLATTTTTARPGIAPLWDDLQCSSGITYQVSGTSPNRVLTVEWLNMEWNWSSSQNAISFQVKLYEGTNAVELVYRNEVPAGNPTGSGGASVGLMGTAAANYVSLQNLTASPTISTTASTNSLSTKPASGQTYRFTPVTPVTYTYAWSSTPSGFAASTASTTANPAVNTTYTVNATSNAGCKASASVPVAVDSNPAVIGTQPLTQQLCQGATATLSVVATSATALSYQWFKDGVAITGNASATTSTLTLTGTTPANSGSYTVTVTNCSTVTSDAAILTVYPTPTAVAPAAQAYCIDATVPATTLTGTPSGVTFNISGGAALGLANQTGVTQIPSFAPTASGTATISITPVANGCTGTAVTYNLTINPLPTAPVLSSNSPICQGSSLNLTATVAPLSGYTLNSNSNVSFIDISATGTTVGVISDDSEHNITIPSFTFNGVAYTTARVGNNGVLTFGSTTGDITFTNTALPVTSATPLAGLASICALWDDLTPGTGGSITTQTTGGKFIVQWTQEDNFGATGTGTVTFQVQLDLTTGQIHLVYPDILYGVVGYDNAQTATIGLNYSTTSALQYSFNTASILNGQSLTFTPAVYTYAWTGPNSFTSAVQNPSIANATPAASGTYTLQITNGNGCKSSATTSATVNPTPFASISGTTDVCQDSASPTVTFTGSNGTAPYTFTYTLNGGSNQTIVSIGNTATIAAPTGAAGTFTYTLVSVQDSSSSTCSNAQGGTAVIKVNPLPTAAIAGSTQVCQNDTAPLVTFTGANGTAPYTFTYKLTGVAGDQTVTTTTGNSVTVAAPTGTAGTFVYSLVSVQDSSSTTCSNAQLGDVTIVVYPTPVVSTSLANQIYFNGLATTAISLGGTPSGVTFDITGGAAIGLANQTVTTEIPSFIPITGTATIGVTPKANGCTGATVYYTATVYAVNANPVANKVYCEGITTSAIALSSTPSFLTGVTYNISGGASVGLADINGVTSIPSFVTIPGSATLTIIPVYGGVFGGSVTTDIIVNPLPTATIAVQAEVCRNDVSPLVTFTGATGTAPYTFTYSINGGANLTVVSSGNIATVAVPTGTAGTFTYTLLNVQDSNPLLSCGRPYNAGATIIVHPTPTVTTTLPNQSYYSGFPTAAIPLAGTPSGVTFNISGGAAAGLADATGVLAIPSFIPTTTPATVTITPVANGCVGIPKTYQIAFNPVVVNLLSNQCGSINHGLNNTINCTIINIPGYTTTGYRFEVTNTSTGVVQYVDKPTSQFKLTDLSNYAYGTVFSIRVAAILNGNVQGFFGNVCTLTTASVKTSEVVTSQCGDTLVFINTTINANTVSSTNLYNFRISLASAPTTYYYIQRTVPNFKLTDVPGLPLFYNTEYLVDVQVRVKLAGFEAWSQFGQRCSIFTPASPQTSVILAQCEMVATSNTQLIYADAFPGATSYTFNLIGYDGNGDVNYTQSFTTPNPYFTLGNFTGLTPGDTYTVNVGMVLYGVPVIPGKDCSITTPLSRVTAVPFKATAYPNPYAENFMIDVKTSSSSVVNIKVYDMVGRLVEQRDVKVSDLESSPIGNRYPTGVYNVVVTQDETVQTVRVVKR